MRRKTMIKAGGAICAVALLTTSAAFAAGGFTDVPDDRFFSDPVQWAVDNEITTGCGDGTTFCPNDGVTRGENITFAYRYDKNVVQPALDDLSERIDSITAPDGDAAAAAASAAAAAASESNAATSAANAATSETNAGTSATNAATSAANAATSETNASSAQTAAEAAQTAAEAAQTAAEAANADNLWVVVDGVAGGVGVTIDRQSGGISVASFGAGYEIDFDTDISGCAWSATPTLTALNVPPALMVSLGPRTGLNDAIFAVVYDSTGASVTDADFTVEVRC